MYTKLSRTDDVVPFIVNSWSDGFLGPFSQSTVIFRVNFTLAIFKSSSNP